MLHFGIVGDIYMPKIKTQDDNSAYQSISKAAKVVGVPAYVLRFWESEFYQIKPVRAQNRRMYSERDIAVLLKIKNMLYKEGYTISGVKTALKSPGSKSSDVNLSSMLSKLQKIRVLLD